jgi:hypothetical protein
MSDAERKSDPTYSLKWFDTMKVATARKLLKRWTEEKVPNDRKMCGTIYGDYLISQSRKQSVLQKGTVLYTSWLVTIEGDA